MACQHYFPKTAPCHHCYNSRHASRKLQSMSELLTTYSQKTWQEELIDSIRDPQILLDELNLPPSLLPFALQASREFQLKVPRPYLNRIAKGDINDPLLQQVLPIGEELLKTFGYGKDPLAEKASNISNGLIHKYRGRVLLIASPNCAVNCRYCFRRHFPYEENNPGRAEWLDIFQRIRADETIKEVILSGGDPLANPDRQLQWMVDQIADIPQIRRLRVHTRLPVMIPQRITSDTLAWLSNPKLQSIVVLHINHPQEIDSQVTIAIAKLRSAGITLLNQAVLLKGINDDASIQVELSEALFQQGVLPYYLHMLDKVEGTAHFSISDLKARQIHKHMQAQLPGFLVPKLVREEPGASNKTLIL